MYRKTPDHLLKRSRNLRRTATPAERVLWSKLKNKQLGGYKFRRQHVLLNYIVDFFCFSKKLIVELDGAIHNTPDAIEYDKKRDELLKANGYTILRFKNTLIFQACDEVLDTILKALDDD